ncbi:PaaI family thioesterase [Alcanivorax sp.]|uniref:PaaI family thioesterase n=1 Tax=Alcanivorax sp. TaxID=1872427 RepID=UPI003BAAF590
MTNSSLPYTRLDVCNRFLESVRHSVVLGLEVLSAEEHAVRVRVPWREDLVGNPETGVMHGGAIFAMMDHAGGMAVTCRTFPTFEITPTIDFRVDHLRGPARVLRWFAKPPVTGSPTMWPLSASPPGRRAPRTSPSQPVWQPTPG